MKDVALLLGLKWDDEKGESEKFEILTSATNIHGYSPFKLTFKNGFIDCDGHCFESYCDSLNKLITGDYTIQKIPKKISFAEAFKTYSSGRTIKSIHTHIKYQSRSNSLLRACDEEIDGEWEVVEGERLNLRANSLGLANNKEKNRYDL